MRATLLYIITSPDVLQNLLTEIASSTLSSPITDSEARKLPYLQAVIKEGLRIFPPVTGFMSKTAPAAGDTIKNIHIPAGTTIGWSPFGLMRNEEIWGPDAKLFRPERWLEGTPDERQRKEQEVEMCFGYGKYQCLGKNIANIELNKIYVEVRYVFLFVVGRMMERVLRMMIDYVGSYCVISNSSSWILPCRGSALMRDCFCIVICG